MKFWVVSYGEHYEAGSLGMMGFTDRDEAIAAAKRVKAPDMQPYTSNLFGYFSMGTRNANDIDWSEVYGFDTDQGSTPVEVIEDHAL